MGSVGKAQHFCHSAISVFSSLVRAWSQVNETPAFKNVWGGEEGFVQDRLDLIEGIEDDMVSDEFPVPCWDSPAWCLLLALKLQLVYLSKKKWDDTRLIYLCSAGWSKTDSGLSQENTAYHHFSVLLSFDLIHTRKCRSDGGKNICLPQLAPSMPYPHLQ